MPREELIKVYLDWLNNFISIERYAEHYGYHLHEAQELIGLAKHVFHTAHPES